jgi:hypothetical protein
MKYCLNLQITEMILKTGKSKGIFFFGATTPIRALAYLHETLRFTSVY